MIATIGAASAATLSINFTESTGHANQQIDPATAAGIGGLTHWNNTAGKSGTLNALVDSDGTTTGASVTWTSSNTWGQGTANADANDGVGDAQLARGYLDDGDPGITITAMGLEPKYNVIIYLSSGDTNEGTFQDITVNGTSYSVTGPITQYATGDGVNYWDASNTITITGLTGDLSIQGPTKSGHDRASIGGLQIETVPEPSSTALLGLGGLALILRRRK